MHGTIKLFIVIVMFAAVLALLDILDDKVGIFAVLYITAIILAFVLPVSACILAFKNNGSLLSIIVVVVVCLLAYPLIQHFSLS
jgi:hypothetical protein